MNIEKWEIERIMQLPDWCFGKQWQVSVMAWASGGVASFDISEDAYPDRMVLWHVGLWCYYAVGADQYIKLALGHQLPTDDAAFMLCEPLLRGIGRSGPDPRRIELFSNAPSPTIPLRMPIEAQGKRLVVEAYAAAEKYIRVHVITVISSMPKEVPDWLISGQAAWR